MLRVTSCLVALAPSPCQDEAPALLFTDVTPEALPDVQTVCGTPAKDWIVEVNGGGLGLEDLDRDGDLDLVVVDGSTLTALQAGDPGRPARVFLGDGRGHFDPAPETWSVGGGRWGTGCAIGDVDGDGWSDIVVTGLDEVRLLRNCEGQGLEERRLPGLGWFTSSALLDYDRDGHLDLFLVRYLEFDVQAPPEPGSRGASWKGMPVMVGPEGLRAQHDVLLRGVGDGTFEDVSEQAGITVARAAFGLGVVTQDVDSDGDTDVYVANDSMTNHLWINQGDGTFEESAFDHGVGHGAEGREQAGMGIACADLSGDGNPDLFVTNFSGEPNAYYESSSRRVGRWRERASRAGISGPSLTQLGWGAGALDVELDGDLDLFVLNGHVYPQADGPGTDTSYAQADQLYVQSAGRFDVRAIHAGPARPSRAGVAGDIDGDGDEDLVVMAVEGAVRVLRNDARARGQWLAVRLGGAAGGAGLGARVTLAWDGGSGVREVSSAGGFQASTPAVAHFAIPFGVESAALTVSWPYGVSRQEVTRFGRVLVVQEGLPTEEDDR